MGENKMYKVGEGIQLEKDEAYYNAGDIAEAMQEAKLLIYNGNNLVTLGLRDSNLDMVLQGLEQIQIGTADVLSAAKHFKTKMADENHFKILIAIEDMVVKPEKEEE